jgi:hypothetical protein
MEADSFEFEQSVGCGAFSEVFKAKNKSGDVFAVKKIRNQNAIRDCISNEIEAGT